jgi:hypothetical protein
VSRCISLRRVVQHSMNWRSWLIFLNSLCFLTLLCSHLGQPIEDMVVRSGHTCEGKHIAMCVSKPCYFACNKPALSVEAMVFAMLEGRIRQRLWLV